MLRKTRLAAVAAGSVLSLCLSVSGCALPVGLGSPAGPSPSPSPSVDAAALLDAAVAKTTGVNVTVVLDDEITGAYDAKGKIASLSDKGGSGEDPMEIVVTADELYLRVGGPKEITLRMKVAKMPADHGLAMLLDPVAPLTLLTGVTEVTSAGEAGWFTGTLDPTKVRPGTTPASRRSVEWWVAQTKGKSISFTAAIDDQGYLSQFVARFTDADDKETRYSLVLSNFGGAVSVAKPTGPTVVNAPAESYQA